MSLPLSPPDSRVTSSWYRYRPTTHFIAPHSWMNDPCGALYIPETKEYIVCYRWNHKSPAGGNTAWGMAKSHDLITWEDLPPAIIAGAGNEKSTYDPLAAFADPDYHWNYDECGVSSGCLTSRLEEGKRVLYLFYTSISELPVHWSKFYKSNCETQSLAISYDLGKSWKKIDDNPILRRPPLGMRPTGWRDPFVSKWPALSKLMGWDRETDWMMVSGGDKNTGSQLLMYRSRAGSLLNWDYCGPLLTAEFSAKISETSNFHWGMNLECGSFLTQERNHYIIVGVEEDGLNSNYDANGREQVNFCSNHENRYLLWLQGDLVLEDGYPKFVVNSHGRLDHGMAYAAHVFRDAEGRLIQLAWVDEECGTKQKREQGWAGCLTHPRELIEIKKRWPFDPSKHPPTHIWNVDKEAGTVTTLGIRPAPPVTLLRAGLFAKPLRIQPADSIKSRNFELKATVGNWRCETGTLRFFILGDTWVQWHLSRTEGGWVTVKQPTQDPRMTWKAAAELCLLPGENIEIRIFVDESIVRSLLMIEWPSQPERTPNKMMLWVQLGIGTGMVMNEGCSTIDLKPSALEENWIRRKTSRWCTGKVCVVLGLRDRKIVRKARLSLAMTRGEGKAGPVLAEGGVL